MKNVRKKAFILVVGIIIAAGALFTAVYDVIYKSNSSNTINLNAATVDYTGKTSWSVEGTKRNGYETTTLNFDNGTWMLLFKGQDGLGGWDYGAGAMCIAFYKGNSMIVNIGEGGGRGNQRDGGGCTSVTTNFALPSGYGGELRAIASGAGAGSVAWLVGYRGVTADLYLRCVDGTFAGWDCDSYTATKQMIGTNTDDSYGLPASQYHDGWADSYDGNTGHTKRTPNKVGNIPDSQHGNNIGYGGGGGYKSGGAGFGYTVLGGEYPGGGGSCTPWCYPIQASDLQFGPKATGMPVANSFMRSWGNGYGIVSYYRIDPVGVPSSGVYGQVEYGNVASIVEPALGSTPRGIVKDIIASYSSIGSDQNFDCGIRTCWVYSVSEDGKSWHGVGPENFGTPTGNRTRDCAVRGRRLNRLTIGAHCHPLRFLRSMIYNLNYTRKRVIMQYEFITKESLHYYLRMR